MSPSKKPSVLITGCSQGGAGNALALEFAARGLRVFATARSLESMSNLSENGIETFALDVTVSESIATLKEEVTKRTGGTLDYLYNNAGEMYEAPALEANPRKLSRLSLSQQRTVPTLLPQSSTSLLASSYNATKAAVSAYSDTLRLELSPLGIRVVTLFMGEVSTKLRSVDGINFGPESIYADVEGKVKERTEHSAKVSLAPDAFARQVVAQILDNHSVSYIWKGTNAFIVWLLNALGPRKVFDSTVTGPVGFDDKSLVKRIYDRGQQFVKQQ